MNPTTAVSLQVRSLMEAMCDGIADDAQVRDLQSLLRASDEVCHSYVELLSLDAELLWLIGSRQEGNAALKEFTVAKQTSPQQQAPTFLSTAFHGTIGYFSEGMPLAYLLATVITGLGLLVGSLIHVSRPEQVAYHSVPVIVESKAYVGRITGTVDCKIGSSHVSLGQKYELASGLMEITYDSGAKVILQGPVTYEVESNGGYLAVGKLTGKLEKRGEGPTARGEKSVLSSSFILHPSSFAIRTPTATVTDLGTEFGVEVKHGGSTETQVFSGEVRIATSGSQGNVGQQTEVVRAGQFARVGQNGRLSVDAHGSGELEKQFIRSLPGRSPTADSYADLVLSMNPTVYYRMEEWPKGKDEDTYVLVDSTPGGHHGILHQDRGFGPRQRGRFGGALELHGPGIGDYAIVPDYPKAENGHLSVSVWVKPWILTAKTWTGIVTNWWSDLQYNNGNAGQFFLGIHADRDLLASVHDQDGKQISVREGTREMLCQGVWHHVAFVADGVMLRLYHNGVEVGHSPCRGITRPKAPAALGVGCQLPDLGSGQEPGNMAPWTGSLDEVAVFNHALTAEQVWQMYMGSATAVRPITVKPGANNNPSGSESSEEEKGGNGKHRQERNSSVHNRRGCESAEEVGMD